MEWLNLIPVIGWMLDPEVMADLQFDFAARFPALGPMLELPAYRFYRFAVRMGTMEGAIQATAMRQQEEEQAAEKRAADNAEARQAIPGLAAMLDAEDTG